MDVDVCRSRKGEAHHQAARTVPNRDSSGGESVTRRDNLQKDSAASVTLFSKHPVFCHLASYRSGSCSDAHIEHGQVRPEPGRVHTSARISGKKRGDFPTRMSKKAAPANFGKCSYSSCSERLQTTLALRFVSLRVPLSSSLVRCLVGPRRLIRCTITRCAWKETWLQQTGRQRTFNLRPLTTLLPCKVELVTIAIVKVYSLKMARSLDHHPG